jgi:hypothetical protein
VIKNRIGKLCRTLQTCHWPRTLGVNFLQRPVLVLHSPLAVPRAKRARVTEAQAPHSPIISADDPGRLVGGGATSQEPISGAGERPGRLDHECGIGIGRRPHHVNPPAAEIDHKKGV